jgi:hypothetical protein
MASQFMAGPTIRGWVIFKIKVIQDTLGTLILRNLSITKVSSL